MKSMRIVRELGDQAKAVEHGQVALDQHDIGHAAQTRGEHLHAGRGDRDRATGFVECGRHALEHADGAIGDHDVHAERRRLRAVLADHALDRDREQLIHRRQRLVERDADARRAAQRARFDLGQAVRDVRERVEPAPVMRDAQLELRSDRERGRHLEEHARARQVLQDHLPGHALRGDLDREVHRVSISVAPHGVPD
jgi:hypothetical protein